MGVTGTPTDIPSGQTVLLLGGGLGNAVLFSIGKVLRADGNQVIYFAGYRNCEDLFKVEDIEAASDLIIWSVDHRPGNGPQKAEDDLVRLWALFLCPPEMITNNARDPGIIALTI